MMRMMTRWAESWAELSCDDDDGDDVDDGDDEGGGEEGEELTLKSNNPNLQGGEKRSPA